MGILVRFPADARRTGSCSACKKRVRVSPIVDSRYPQSSPQASPVVRQGTLEERVLRNIEETSVARGSPHPDLDRYEDRVARFSGLEELVLFSPEIQVGVPRSAPAGTPTLRVEPHWGDVFIKVDERYRFAFTVYTGSYVSECRRRFGEKIVPSAQDVVLNRKFLVPRDILRAALKWINLYCPFLCGTPLSLEREEVLENLTCDPGVEVFVAGLS